MDATVVVAMYTKGSYSGAKYESISEAHSVGLSSNVYVKVYASFAGAIFTSIACPTLACATYLQIPRTHIVFSLASYPIERQDITSADAHPFTMITLGSTTATLHQEFVRATNAVDASVRALQQLITISSPKAAKAATEIQGVVGGQSSVTASLKQILIPSTGGDADMADDTDSEASHSDSEH